jgi:hypothetical protein
MSAALPRPREAVADILPHLRGEDLLALQHRTGLQVIVWGRRRYLCLPTRLCGGFWQRVMGREE